MRTLKNFNRIVPQTKRINLWWYIWKSPANLRTDWTWNYLSYVDIPNDALYYKVTKTIINVWTIWFFKWDWTDTDIRIYWSYSDIPSPPAWYEIAQFNCSYHNWAISSSKPVDYTQASSSLEPWWEWFRDWDNFTLVLQEKTSLTYTLTDCNPVSGTIWNEVNNLVWNSQTRYNDWILWSDWYWYAIACSPYWNPYLYYIVFNSNWTIKQYNSTSKPWTFSWSWMPNYFNSLADESPSMFNQISNELWTTITSTQEFWEYIYNRLS